MLNDLTHYFSNDLNISNTGDIATVTGINRGQQRILRRLLTNPGAYIFQPQYGAGLPQFIGQVLNIPQITALIRSQIFLEDSVAKNPPPSITVTPILNGVSVYIKYTDASSDSASVLSFNVNK